MTKNYLLFNLFELQNYFSKFKRENRPGFEYPVEEKDVENMLGVFVDKEKARVLRKERELALAKRALHRYSTDSNYRFLHDQISDLFAELLKSDTVFKLR